MFDIKQIILSCFLLLSFYHFVSFLDRKNDKRNLSFSLYCLGISGIIIFYWILPDTFIKLNNIYIFFSFISVMIAGYSFHYFIIKICNFNFNKFIRFLILVTIPFNFTILSMYLMTHNNLFIITFSISMAFLGLLLILSYFIYFILQEKYLNKLYLAVLITLTFIVYILKTLELTGLSHIYISFEIICFSTLIFTFIFSIILSVDIKNEYDELFNLENKLELKIPERTNKIKSLASQKTNPFIKRAHEAKTPLALIANYLKKYKERTGSSEELEIIEQNFDKLKSDMVNLDS